jgi:transcriptional regulator with GAF, ATPase, and Fis domain
MDSTLLDLLDAITEVRVRNPDLRQAVLASLRLAIGEGWIRAGRLYVQRIDGELGAIMVQGEPCQDEAADRALVEQFRSSGRDPVRSGEVLAVPLRTELRLYAVLLLEMPREPATALLSSLFLQWASVAEFLRHEKAELIDENYQLREQVRVQFSDRNIIGVSGVFRHVIDSARRVAASTATVLIQGETGTGKELVARIIHEHSPRANQAFITVNCGALTESLLETELFGHVKGAFTGAIADRKGRFEAADKGSIFLDEIGEISPAMQVRLLRVLQEMEVVRVGDHRSRKLDVRVVAATNRDLEAMVREGSFRADLFYRLNVVHLSIPPLRGRREDVPLLVEHFLSVYCQRNCKYIEAIDREVLEVLQGYPWPGNVRELENCIEKMVVMAPGRMIGTELLPMAVMAYRAPVLVAGPMAGDGPISVSLEEAIKRWLQVELARIRNEADATGELYDTVRSKWERHLFEVVLDACDNNKSKAAKILGITRNTLNAKLGELSQITRSWNFE